MPSSRLFIGLGLVVAAFFVGGIAQLDAGHADRQLQPIRLKLRVIELNSSKLHRIGLDFRGPIFRSLVSRNSAEFNDQRSANEILNFVEGLRQYDCAHVLAEPQLVSVADRKATLSITAGTKYEFLVSQPRGERVNVEYSIQWSSGALLPETALENRTKRFSIASECECELGEMQLLSSTRSRIGEDSALVLVFLQADLHHERK